jgi:hypothetical protein
MDRYTRVKTMKNQCLIFLFAFLIAGCGYKESNNSNSDNRAHQQEQKEIDGQIFIVTKGGETIRLGDVEVTLFDLRQMWTCINSNALQWSNALAIAQAKVDEAKSNYDALYKDDIDKFSSAKKYHDNIMQTASPGTPEWEQAFEWSTKLTTKINNLVELKNSSDAKSKLDHAIWKREFQWDYINWPKIVNLIAAGCDTDDRQTTTTDSDGRFKFVVPSSSPDVVIYAKAERQVGNDKEKLLWLIPVETPAGENEVTNNLWLLKLISESPNQIFWFPKVKLKANVTKVVLSDSDKADYGLSWYFDDTNVASYMSGYNATVESEK